MSRHTEATREVDAYVLRHLPGDVATLRQATEDDLALIRSYGCAGDNAAARAERLARRVWGRVLVDERGRWLRREPSGLVPLRRPAVRALVADAVLADRAALADALARLARDLDWSPEVERAALRAVTRRADEYVGFCVRTRTVAETLALAAPMLTVDDATLAFLFGGRAPGEETRPAVSVASPDEFVASLDLSPGTRVPFADVLRGYAAARGLAQVPALTTRSPRTYRWRCAALPAW